ncbi:DNA internalization-related competence protein ComEC/Rec2 [Rheinheimera sp. WS51]|uniref:DNA internalization-related competence protein ComEC/Rec2 n=1 Tax=Rheinheimera sp. WS51 TaxID=3425886 RepID=UPI003D91B0B7
MTLFCLGVFAASLLSLFFPIVPPLSTLFILVPIVLLAIWYRRPFILGATLFLCFWLLQTKGYYTTQQQLLAAPDTIIGTIIETPKIYLDYSQIVLQLNDGVAKDYRVRLNWPSAPVNLHAGQKWQLKVRLKPIMGLANPSSLNYESHAMLNHILAQGSIVQQRDNSQLNSPIVAKLLGTEFLLRPYLIKQLTQATSELDTRSLLLALTVGERQFTQQLWQGLQLSALSHLMAISGLHIGLVFVWSLWLAKYTVLIKNVNCRTVIQYSIALGCALLYAWLAGFSIPTLRASFALLILVMCKIQHRSFSFLQYWLIIVAFLLLVNPFFVLSIGFWLSILAVAIIFLLIWQQPRELSGWRNKFILYLRFHLYLTLIMSLFSVLFFNGSSGLALVSNLVFVPFSSIIAIPMLLVTLIFELIQLPFAGIFWQLTDWIFTPLLLWLQWCSEQQSWWAWPNMHWLTTLALLLAIIVLWLTRLRIAVLYCGLVVVVIAINAYRATPWQLHLIDVGQGLALLLQKDQHGLLYDVGPRYNNYSATSSQVLPYLRQAGIRHLDYIVLSHNDSDHTGDWQLLQQYYPELRLITNIDHASQALPCHDIQLRYHGAKVVLFSLDDLSLTSKNDRSCIMQLDIEGWQLLIPGDISSRAERILLAQQPDLKANVLLLGHHGSASSSEYVFLHQVSPQLALNSASLYNRHQHPSEQVRQRLEMLGIPMLNTATSGAIRLQIRPNSVQILPYRPQRLPLWQ